MISDSIRTAARESGKTQLELAALTGVSQRAISDFLSGRAVYSHTLDSLAAALGLEVVRPLGKAKKSRKKPAA